MKSNCPFARRQAARQTRPAPLIVASMLAVVLLAHAGLSSAAPAPTFEERLERARAAERNPAFKPYLQAMGARLGQYMGNGVQNCLIKVQNPDLSPFILVADINKNGEPIKIDVKPRNAMSECFAGAFKFMPFPKPAPYVKADEVPIFFDMVLK